MEYTNNIYIKKSDIHGFGVFAKRDIKSGELLEEVPFLVLPINRFERSSLLIDYRFNYPSGNEPFAQVIPGGFFCWYNHSSEPTAYWESKLGDDKFRIYAKCDIKKYDDIFVYYGDESYWNDGRSNIEIK